MLSLFRLLTELRRRLPALYGGSFTPLETSNGNVLAYAREADGERVVVALDFGSATETVDLSGAGRTGEVLCSTLMDAVRLTLWPGLPSSA